MARVVFIVHTPLISNLWWLIVKALVCENRKWALQHSTLGRGRGEWDAFIFFWHAVNELMQRYNKRLSAARCYHCNHFVDFADIDSNVWTYFWLILGSWRREWGPNGGGSTRCSSSGLEGWCSCRRCIEAASPDEGVRESVPAEHQRSEEIAALW